MTIPVVIGALETISKNANAWPGRLSLPDAFGSAQKSAMIQVLLISCGKCFVSKLRKASMSWLRIPRKYQRIEEDYIIIITVTITITTTMTKTIIL